MYCQQCKVVTVILLIWIRKTNEITLSFQIQGNIHPHAIIILPNTNGMELLLSYEDEGVYIDTYGHFTKENVLQWGEMPASVGECLRQSTAYLNFYFYFNLVVTVECVERLAK